MTEREYRGNAGLPQTWPAYVSPFDDTTPPPPVAIEYEPPESPNAQQTQAGLIVIVAANLLVTAIIICVMLFDGDRAADALARGTRYFAVTTPLYLLIITGTLTKVVARVMREWTERQRIKSYERVMVTALEWRQAIEANHALQLQAQALPADLSRRLAQLEHDALERSIAGGVQGGNTFVAPYDNRSQAAFAASDVPDSTAAEALAWARGLYGVDGLPDARQVQMTGEAASWGRLRVKMLGSKRGGGTREAGLWLLQRRIVVRVPGGYRLNLERFPRRETLRNLL